MRRERNVSIVVVVCLLFLSISVTIIHNSKKIQNNTGAYGMPLQAASVKLDPMKGINPSTFSVDETFETHLPIVIIDTHGVKPPISTEQRFIHNEWIFTDIEGVQPYVEGVIQVIGTQGNNHITDQPSVTSKISIKRRGNTSMLYDKAQYMIKLVSSKGEENKQSILGMGTDNEWILNGSMADKSLMRNYLAYRTASKFMPFTPDFKYCEVIFKENEQYTYMGLYLIGESVKQGKNRVDIEKFESSRIVNSFLVRRDRYDKNDTMLDTYATQNKLTEGEIALLYPTKKYVTTQMKNYAEDEISKVEKVLYSDDYKVFSTYPNYIDVDSFVDYFLMNEFFASYDSGTFSTYMYKKLGGKLTMGPVWDYDGTMDNYVLEPLDVNVMAFQIKPWYDRLCTDITFVHKLEKRYGQLRRTYLASDTILGEIDEIVSYIGPAKDREWTRWGYIYKEDQRYSLQSYRDEDGDEIFRDTREFEQEIYRLKTVLKKHGDSIATRLKLLEGCCKWETGWTSRTGVALFLILAILSVTVIQTRRR